MEPVEVFELFKDDDHSFFLDSGLREGKLGCCSFIGSNPFLTYRSKGEEIEIVEGGRVHRLKGNPLDELERLMGRYRLASLPGFPLFQGGAVGYFGYDLCRFIEQLPSRSVDDLGLPDCYFGFYDTILAFDHLTGKSYIASTGFPAEDDREAEERARLSIETIEDRLNRQSKAIILTPFSSEHNQALPTAVETEIESMFTKEGYKHIVDKAKGYIKAGDIYEVNLSHRLSTDLRAPPFELYRRLRRINPAPFSSFLNFGKVKLASASPERFLKMAGNRAQCRPMKGTRPRGKNPVDNQKLRWELATSEKDLAENLMIVDLVRNDLGRVCRYGTVEATESFVIEEYATVFQMVSTVEGKLNSGHNRFDCIKACFPGGSMTGAPKIRAMEIIDELEPIKRGIYSGSIGYLSFTGDMDLNIVIRTFIIKNGKIYFQVGGAVVADSNPEAEYQETLDKAKALIEALNLGG